MNWYQVTIFAVVLTVFVATAAVTLLGITGYARVQSRYLRPLVAGLLLEVAVAVVFLFRSFDFVSPTASDFIDSLPAELSGESPQVSRDRIRDLVSEANALRPLSSEIEPLRSRVAELTTELDDSRMRIAELEAEGRHFLVRLVRFHRAAGEFGRSLNLTVPADPAKDHLAEQLLELLAEIGQYDGQVVADPARAKAALIAYQRSKEFSEVGWYSQKTFDAMVADHIAVAVDAQSDPAAGVRGSTPTADEPR